MKKNLDFHRLLAGPIKVALCALCAALALFASGCSGEDTAPSSVAIVASNVSNQEVYPYELLGDTLTETASTGGWVDVLIADGHPRTVLEGGVQSAAASSTAAQVRATQAQAIAEAFVNEAAGAQAQCAETDVLGGLSAAAASLAQAPGSHTVHLFSSLLSTAGVVNLAEHPEWVSAPAGSDITSEELHARVVEQLKPLLPGMSCVSKVVIYGAGVTAGDQAAPNTAQTNDLKDLWSQILLACGVGEVQYVTAPLSGKETEGAYPVSTVELPQVTVDIEIPQAPEPEPDPEPEPEPTAEPVAVVNFDDTTVPFVPDTAELADPDTARQAVAELASTMANYPTSTVTLVGSTAGCPWSEDHGVSLGLERAQAVAKMLTDAGVGAERITVIGLGDQSNDLVKHVPDILADGTQDKDAAQQNRRVVAVVNQ